jgi:hypothetical protein
MVVSEGVFCVPSQNRQKKAHIVQKELDISDKDVLVPNTLLLEAANLMDPERNIYSSQEIEKRKYNLLMALWNLANEELEYRYTCTCEDFQFHGEEINCKHILAVKLNQKEVI